MKRLSLILAAVLGLVLAGDARAAFNGFAKFGDIKGESTDVDHPGWIEVLSADWGAGAPNLAALRPGTTATGGPGVLQFAHRPGASSPQLQRAFERKQLFPKVQLDIPKPGQSEVKYYTITLTNARISSYSKGSSAFPTETIKLDFTKIDYKAPAEPPRSLQAKPV